MMDRVPLISIIITSYNYGRFLGHTIDSALAQSHPRVEVIVVDDGSTDDSRDVIARYLDQVVPILKQNGGQASAFNAGFQASSGEIICFLDSDDLLLPTAAESAARRMQDPSVVKVHWPLWLVDEQGINLGGRLPIRGFPCEDLRELTLRDGPYYDWNHLPPTSGNAWSRRFLAQILPMPEPPYRICADEYLFTLAPVYGKIEPVESPQGCYRTHGANHGWGRELEDEKVRSDLARLEYGFQILSQHLERMGITPDPDAWRERNWNYQWMRRLLAAKAELRLLVPEGSAFVLVDDGEWGGLGLAGKRSIRFLEKDGEYGGRPANDAQAINELERLRSCGCILIAFWWTAFWWLEHYAGLHRHLRERSRCVLDNDGLIVFDLR